MVHEAEDEEVQLDQDSAKETNEVQELVQSTMKMRSR